MLLLCLEPRKEAGASRLKCYKSIRRLKPREKRVRGKISTVGRKRHSYRSSYPPGDVLKECMLMPLEEGLS